MPHAKRHRQSLSQVALAAVLFTACAKAGAGDSSAPLETGTPAASSGSGDPTSAGADSNSSGSTSGGVGGNPHTSVGSSSVGAGSGVGGASSTEVAAGTNASAGVGTSSSSGQGGASPGDCDHDVCTVGAALKSSCDACSASLCANDPYCCDTAWDSLCVSQTKTYCAGDPCGLAGSSSSTASSTGGGGGDGGVLAGDLLITEIMNDPAKVDDAKGEWFEVHNTTASPIDLKGLVLRHQLKFVDANAVEPIGKSLIVQGGGYVVLGNNSDPTTNGGVKVDYVFSVKVTLNNTKDYIALETSDMQATTIDEASYDTAKLKLTGKSRNLDPAWMSTLGNDDDTHFCGASSLIANSTDFGTPGKSNDACK